MGSGVYPIQCKKLIDIGLDTSIYWLKPIGGFMALTLEQAKALSHGQVLYHPEYRNADGSPQRWRVSGKPKTWKTRPAEIRVPIMHGLYDHDYLDQRSLHLLCLTEKEAYALSRKL